jgi:hypothetical protein
LTEPATYRALRPFRYQGIDYKAGDALPPKARMWIDLRSLQRRGDVSWEPGNPQDPKAAPAPVSGPSDDVAVDAQEPDEEAQPSPEGGARGGKRRKRAAA